MSRSCRERTGLVLDPYFSGTKIEWLRREGGVPDGAVFGTIDSWLAYKLTGRHVTDYSNASRTLLFDIRRLDWDPELCELLGVDPAALPEPLPSAGVFGETSELGGSVPVAGIAGDQQAALYGQACHEPGLGKNTYGTGSFVLQNAGQEAPPPVDGLLTTVAWGVEGRVDYALEAAIFVTGAAVQWLRDALGVIGEAAETEGLARSLDGNDGVYLVPAFTGLGSPHWDPYARGTIVGLTRGTGTAHLARAALESIGYQTVDAVRAMESASGVRLDELKADGGAVENAWLMQFQADVLGVPVVVPEVSETTALGAALPRGRGHRDVERAGRARDVARGRSLRAGDAGGRARRAALRMAPRPRPLARVGARGVTKAPDPGRERSSEGAGVQGPAARRAFHGLPRARAPRAARLDVRAGPAGAHALPAALLPRPLHRLGQGARGRPGDHRPEPLLVPRPLLRGRLPAPQGALHGEVAAVHEARFRPCTRTAASSRCAAASATRRRSRPPTRS